MQKHNTNAGAALLFLLRQQPYLRYHSLSTSEILAIDPSEIAQNSPPYQDCESDELSAKMQLQEEGLHMKLTSLIADNITEVLVKIIEFTRTRQKILTRNITNAHNPKFVPKDLAVNEFSESLTNAIDEHIRNRRLLLRDTKNIKFGVSGSLEAKPVVDEWGKKLLKKDRDEYFDLQIDKLLHNSLNQKVAAELLRQRQETVSTDY